MNGLDFGIDSNQMSHKKGWTRWWWQHVRPCCWHQVQRVYLFISFCLFSKQDVQPPKHWSQHYKIILFSFGWLLISVVQLYFLWFLTSCYGDILFYFLSWSRANTNKKFTSQFTEWENNQDIKHKYFLLAAVRLYLGERWPVDSQTSVLWAINEREGHTVVFCCWFKKKEFIMKHLSIIKY